MKRKRRSRRTEGHVYRRGDIWWIKWTGSDGRPQYRSSASPDRAVAEDMLGAELARKAKGLTPSPDPRLCLVDDLESLEARYTTEGRRSLARLKFSMEHLLRMFRGVQAIRVTGADVLGTRSGGSQRKRRPRPSTASSPRCGPAIVSVSTTT